MALLIFPRGTHRYLSEKSINALMSSCEEGSQHGAQRRILMNQRQQAVLNPAPQVRDIPRDRVSIDSTNASGMESLGETTLVYSS